MPHTDKTRVAEVERLFEESTARIADLETENRKLKEAINSNELTAPLHAALHRAQHETTLANQLLTATLDLSKNTTRHWLPVPSLDFTQQQPGLCWNLETAKRGFNLTRVSGWAYINDDGALRCSLPCLLAIGMHSTWLLPGIMVERPDVLSVFPAQGQAAANRLQSGFVFEISSGQLPDNIRAWRIMLGSINQPPVVSPEFQLT